MDGVSIAANIVALATAGVAIAIKLITLATQISTASERVSSIGNDISLTAGVLHQLGELMTQKTIDDGISIFSQGGLETTRTSAAMCQKIFEEVERELKKATEQIRGCKRLSGGKVKLSKTEKAKWPFLQPSIDVLRADLREAKGTLMLMLQVTSLALSKRMADLNHSATSDMIEQRDFMRAIVALHQQQHNADDKLIRTRSALWKASVSPDSSTRAANRSIDLSSSGEETATTSVYSQAPILPAYTRTPMRIAKSIGNNRDLPMQVSYASKNLIARMPGNLGEDNSPGLSLAAFPSSSYSDISENGSTTWPDFSRNLGSPSPNASEGINRNDPNEELIQELELFLLKPMVRDFFDKIELSWSIQKIRMQGPAIRKQMDKNEADGAPSVIDMLENLHAYEQAMVDTELSGTNSRPEASLLSLKRTKTDIRHRDITLKDVPGLQFVVERQIAPTPPRPVGGMKGHKQRVVTGARSSSTDTGHEISRGFIPKVDGEQREPTVVPASGKRFASYAGTKGGVESQFRNDSVKQATNSELAAESEPPFAGLESLTVVDDGLVEDNDGNTVGVVFAGDAKALIGCAVNEYGDVVNKYGKVEGHAEPYEEPEEDIADFFSIDGKRVSLGGQAVDDSGTMFGHFEEGDTAKLGEKVDHTGHWSDDEMTIGQAGLLPGGGTQPPEGGSSHSEDIVNHLPTIPEASMAPSSQPQSSRVLSDNGAGGTGLSQPIPVNTEEAPTAKGPENEPQESSIGSSGYQMITINTEDGPVQVPVDVKAASNVADEKRKRNASASARFRQRRHEREREASQRISELEQIREKTSLLRLESQDPPDLCYRFAPEDESTESPDEGPMAEQDEDMVVTELLEKYTTLFG